MNRPDPSTSFVAHFTLATPDGYRRWTLTHERPAGTEQEPEGNGWFASYAADGTLLVAQPLCYAFAFINNYVPYVTAREWLRKEVHNYAAWLGGMDEAQA